MSGETSSGFSAVPLGSALISEVTQEISSVVKSPMFRQAPKLCTLLEYVCFKALHEGGENVTEYTIAIDVFSKPLDFKERKDSSVRVEIYRLRKRLAHFYENEGRDHPIRIVVPHGRYAPEFVATGQHSETVLPSEILVANTDAKSGATVESSCLGEAAATLPSEVLIPQQEASVWRRWRMLAGLFAVLVAVVVLSFYRASSHNQIVSAANGRVAPQSRPTSSASVAALPVAPIRIMAGYSGPPRRDVSGTEWVSDRYFHGGRAMHQELPRIGRTNDPLLFQNARIGEFGYDVPVPPGNYEVHLYFVEREYGPEVGRGENDRTFFLHINDTRVTPAIDIESEAMGPNIADERVFRDVRPGSDGALHIAFESATGVPLLNAIEILKGLPNAQLPIRLGTHPVPLVDHLGHVWQADNYFLNGQTCPRNQGVAGTPDPALFALERYGHFDYAIPVDVRGLYTVNLHFAEFYFGPTAPGKGGVGSRVFNVTCNGVLLLQNLDIFKEAGNGRALMKTAYHMKPSAQGKLNLTFEPVVNYALIYGIEVLDESK